MKENESYLLGFVLASSYRKKVILALKDKPKTPVMVANDIGIPQSHVSTNLTELTKKGLVVCITPELKKGRLYELTKEGQKILKLI